MPVNPITLDKIEPVVIKQVESKIIDRIVHESKETETNKENSNSRNFNRQQQEQAAQKFEYFLSKYNMVFEYTIHKNRFKIRIKDKNKKLIIETELDDMEKLLDGVKKETGSIIDLKG
jgi:hydroxymethylpyrimidine pyrophosphatase-like HAD family hydrolase